MNYEKHRGQKYCGTATLICPAGLTEEPLNVPGSRGPGIKEYLLKIYRRRHSEGALLQF
jgi:hypothetical protein